MNHNIDPDEITAYIPNQRPNRDILKALCDYFGDPYKETKHTLYVRRWGKRFVFDEHGDVIDIFVRILRGNEGRYVSTRLGEHEGKRILRWDEENGMEKI